MEFYEVDSSKPVQTPASTTDWDRCVLCQTVTHEKLTCPGNSKRGTTTEGYQVLSSKLQEFADISSLPFDLDLEKLAGNEGLFQSFVNNKASWHKSCYSLCSSSRLERARKRRLTLEKTETLSTDTSPAKTRKCAVAHVKDDCCMFCAKTALVDNLGPLRKVLTKEASDFIKKSATFLHDRPLMARCEGTFDLMADDSALYHKICYTDFRNRVRAKQHEESIKKGSTCHDATHGLALTDLVSYIHNIRKSSNEAPVFKLSDLAKRYDQSMSSMGVEYECHTSRLREKLLQMCPFLEASGTTGKDILITYKSDVDQALRSLATKRVDDAELHAAAKYLRNAIFGHTPCSWTDMSEETQKACVPKALSKFVKMCLDGPKSLTTETQEFEQEVMTIAQLIYYHTSKRRKGNQRRHDSKKETPVVVYMSMKLYASTRKKELVDIAYGAGVGISYDRVQSHLTNIANAVCDLAQQEGAVCPVSMKKGIFTTAAVDNVDHNTASTTAKDSFHGTAISLVQHPDSTDQGTTRTLSICSTGERQKVAQLPAKYANVLPSFLNAKNAICPASGNYVLADLKGSSEVIYEQEEEWLQKCLKAEDCMPWSAFHAQQERNQGHSNTPVNIAVLPVFREQAHTLAMMEHAMKVTKDAVNILNPGQTVVLTADQPLFALLQQIQFLKPDTYGPKNFFFMFGGLHIEQTALKTLGDWLGGSGWTDLIAEAEITSAGRAESMLHASHVRRTRYTHEVTVAALQRLQTKAYDIFVEENEGSACSFQDWRKSKCSSIPQFKYWDTTLHFELALLQFVRSLRTADFQLMLKSLNLLLPWFFALDHVNYARWLSVHARDLACLPATNPALAEAFQAGKFVANKTGRPFSSMALDQAHEQVNAELKGDGGMIGLTEDPAALLKWMLTSPEQARIVNKFEQTLRMDGESDVYSLHHSETASSEVSFRKHVNSLVKVFELKGSPFLENSLELYNIETQKVAPNEVVQTIFNIEEKGKAQYRKFVEDRLTTGTVNLMDPIKLNKYPVLKSSPAKKQVSKTSAKLTDAKEDSSLFSRLYIACHTRKGDPAEFFKHENHLSPPAFAIRGEMRTTKKSALLPCLTDGIECASSTAPRVTVKLIDGAVIVNMIRPGTSRTFGEYADVFSNYIQKELSSTLRVDVVWDRYLDDSLKNCTRLNRGEGTRTRVSATTKIPKGWPNFLRISKNKEELFALLSDRLGTLVTPNKELYATDGEMVKTNNASRCDLTALQPCSHEEADTRLMVHAADAAKEGHSRIMIRTVDTDVVVLAVAIFDQVDELEEFWISLGTGKHHQYVPVHEIVKVLGPEKSKALPMFHAFTGCDTIESFHNIGKPSAFAAWMSFPQVTDAFLSMGTEEFEKNGKLLEQYVIIMYDRTSACTSVNDCRLELVRFRGRQMENIPPPRTP